MQFVFSAFGLTIKANRLIPGLIPKSFHRPIDVTLELLGSANSFRLSGFQEQPWYVSPYLGEGERPLLTVWRTLDGDLFRFQYDDRTEFVIDVQAWHVWATWPSHLTIEDTAPFILGPILGFVLRLRGNVCLHASVIGVGNRAIALLGRAGAGRSTTAAAFAQRGYPILSDDIATLIDNGNSFGVQSAYPRLRLCPSSVEALYGKADALPRIAPDDPTWNKCYLDLLGESTQFISEPRPLTAVYILGSRTNDKNMPKIKKPSARESQITLIANTYMNYLLDKEQRAVEFDVLSRLVANVSIRQLSANADISLIGNLCDAILDDLL